MNTTHTPGPWKHQPTRGRQLAIDRKWEIVALLPEGGQYVIVGEQTGIDCLNEANAILIAAAPDLYHAAMKVIDAAWEGGDLAAAVRELNEATDKAKP